MSPPLPASPPPAPATGSPPLPPAPPAVAPPAVAPPVVAPPAPPVVGAPPLGVPAEPDCPSPAPPPFAAPPEAVPPDVPPLLAPAPPDGAAPPEAAGPPLAPPTAAGEPPEPPPPGDEPPEHAKASRIERQAMTGPTPRVTRELQPRGRTGFGGVVIMIQRKRMVRTEPRPLPRPPSGRARKRGPTVAPIIPGSRARHFRFHRFSAKRRPQPRFRGAISPLER